MTSLKKALGASPERLRRHAEIIDKMIEQIIAQNLSRNSHIDVEPIHNEVLSRVTIDKTAKTSPGKDVWEDLEAYASWFGGPFPGERQGKAGPLSWKERAGC